MYNSTDYTNGFNANKQDIKSSFMKMSFLFTYKRLNQHMSDRNRGNSLVLTQGIRPKKPKPFAFIQPYRMQSDAQF